MLGEEEDTFTILANYILNVLNYRSLGLALRPVVDLMQL